MFIPRQIEQLVRQSLSDGFVTIVYGARQVGKTTLAKHLMSTYPDHLYLNCDDPIVVSNLANKSVLELKSYLGNSKFVVIDEAQRVENIGITLKLLHDTHPEIKLLVTGSSSLELANKIAEPLTGRSSEINLFPLSIQEVSKNQTEIQAHTNVMLVRGGYPGMWHLPAEKAYRQLDKLASDYVFKDAFSPNSIYDQTIINDLLRLLAYQLGQEVNYTELGRKLSISKDTVARYIDLLEKAFIIFRRNQYRRNERAEVGRLRKVFFYDLGVRNAMIGNFKPLEFRDDVGALWENFCIIERLKYIQASQRRVRSYYWRNYDQQEIDIIEEESDTIRAFECKFSNKKLVKIPKSYIAKHPESSFSVVTPKTFSKEMLS